MVAGLAGLGLLMFFLPLLSIRVPIVGEQNISGYDVISKAGQFSRQFAAAAPAATQGPQTAQEDILARLPLSVRVAGLIGFCIWGVFGAALATLAGAFHSRAAAKWASAAGAVLGLAAVIHIHVMNSDIHTMLHQVVSEQGQRLHNNAFASFAQALGNMLVNAVQMRPGSGLYVLVLALALAAVVTHSRVLTRLRFADAS